MSYRFHRSLAPNRLVDAPSPQSFHPVPALSVVVTLNMSWLTVTSPNEDDATLKRSASARPGTPVPEGDADDREKLGSLRRMIIRRPETLAATSVSSTLLPEVTPIAEKEPESRAFKVKRRVSPEAAPYEPTATMSTVSVTAGTS